MEDCVERISIRRQIIASLLALLGVFAISSSAEAQQPDFPYQALVITQGAKVYSGPGEMHYSTEELATGTIVEVYRHDPGGWCAIRPTSDSFSLLPQAAVVIISKHIGEVTEDGLQAWVGTTLGPVENPLWQIKLKAGERVELLGEISWPEANGESTAWYQIAPPNGEFRWIHLDDIKLPPTEIASEFDNENTLAQTMIGGHSPSARQQPAENDGWRPSKKRAPTSFDNDGGNDNGSEIRLTTAIQQLDSGGRSGVSQIPTANSLNSNQFSAFNEPKNENGFVRPTVNPRQFATQQINHDQPVRRDAGINLNSQRPDRFASSDSAFGGIGVGQAESLREIQPMSSARLSPRLRMLDMRLSTEVVKQDYSRWQLQDIGLDVQRIASAPADISEQVAAERLLNKIYNFRKIQESSRRTDPTSQGSGISLPAGGVGSGTRTDTGSNRNATASIYDAQGWLNELVRERGNLDSTYVLQDEQGRITHHVQPAPGLNLNRYLRSRVGIIGSRGFNQQLNLNHVVAERIIVLEKPNR